MKDRDQNIQDALRQARENALTGPGHFVFPPKTSLSVTSYREGEVFDIEQALEYINAWRLKGDGNLVVAIQGKYDGVSCFLHHTKDGEFFAFTENGTDVTDRLPHLIQKAASELPRKDYILLGELEKWTTKDGKYVHGGREVIAGELNSQQKPTEDSTYVWNFHDVIWFDGADLHLLTYAERYKILSEKFNFGQSLLTKMRPGFNLVPTMLCRTSEEIEKVLRAIAKIEFLEGAMIKKWNGFKFELDGRTSDVLKFKKYSEAHLWVVDSRLIRGAEKTYQYKVAIEILPAELDEADPSAVMDFNGRKAMVVAKTFNTSVEAKKGDIVTVRFRNVFAVTDDHGRFKLSLYEPRVIENRTAGGFKEEPDTLSSLIKIARDARLLVQKNVDDFYPLELIKQVSVFQQYPAEDQIYSFIIHLHYRGRSVHADLRLSHVNRRYLIGYTLDIQIPGKITEPVVDLETAKKLAKDNDLFKFNPTTGHFQQRQTRGGLKQYTSVLVQLKEPEPNEWLSFEGVVEAQGVGATAQYPGVFLIAARGQVEYGFRTPYFHEYWMHCDAWEDGGTRLLFRELSSEIQSALPIAKFLQWVFDSPQPIDEYAIYYVEDQSILSCSYGEVQLPPNLQVDFDDLIKVLPPSEEPNLRTPTMWMLIKPNDNIPYILTPRAVEKGRIPPYGVSALPRAIREQIPKELRYWLVKGDEAKKVRDTLVARIKQQDLKIDWDIFSQKRKEIEKAVEVERTFVLNRRTWRGPIVVRVGYSAELYDLWISAGEGAMLFTFSENPMEFWELSCTMRKFNDKKLMQLEGNIPPSTPLNPNKKITAKVERIAAGKLLMYIDDPFLKKFKVQSSKWRGLYLLTQDEGTNIWHLQKTSTIGEPREGDKDS